MLQNHYVTYINKLDGVRKLILAHEAIRCVPFNEDKAPPPII